MVPSFKAQKYVFKDANDLDYPNYFISVCRVTAGGSLITGWAVYFKTVRFSDTKMRTKILNRLQALVYTWGTDKDLCTQEDKTDC